MFERFTEQARGVVVLAQEEAHRLVHNYIGTEHILLGLIRQNQGVAAWVLEAMEISSEDVRVQVEEISGHGKQSPSGHIPLTPRAKKRFLNFHSVKPCNLTITTLGLSTFCLV